MSTVYSLGHMAYSSHSTVINHYTYSMFKLFFKVYKTPALELYTL